MRVAVALLLATAAALAAAQSTISLLVGLQHAPGSVAALEARVLAQSDPLRKDALFGSQLSLEQLAEIIGAPADAISSVRAQLELLGCAVSVLATRDWLEVRAPAAVASRLLHSPAERSIVLGASASRHIRLVKATGSSDPARPAVAADQVWRKIVQDTTAAPAVSGSPVQQKLAYGIPATQKGSNPNNTQMVWGPGTFGFLKSDLAQFYSTFHIDGDTSLLSTRGFPGKPGGDNFGECSLDMTYISSMGLGIPTIACNTNTSQSTEEGAGFGPALLQFVTNLAAAPDAQVPRVLSMSLGSLSWDSCNMLCTMVAAKGKYTLKQCQDYMQLQRQVCMFDSGDEADALNLEFMKLGSRGVTLLAATGDGGSHFSFQPFSPFGIGAELNEISCYYNFPTMPAASPWVTGVGGTAWPGDPKAPVAWSGSGSSFDWRFAMPDYQKAAVAGYLQIASKLPGFPPSDAFNSSNRAYPDVAALSDNTPMVMQGQLITAGGTSASAPSFAGIVSLINDVRMNNGLGSLGFLNPRLYAINAAHPGEAFFDVTQGNSKTSCATGFPATKGWDPTTGLGSPLWDGMLKYLSVD